MNRITNIKIENIKGFSTINNSFDVEIISSKINILVAPNGFGKSSITTAFNSLAPRKIELDKADFHNENESLIPALYVTEDGIQYVANDRQNQISQIFKIFVVKNLLVAKAIGQNMGKFFHTKGYLGVDTIEIVKTIPEPCNILYSKSDIRRKFGRNGKVLSNISTLLKNTGFLCKFNDDYYADLEKFTTQKRKLKIEKIVNQINSMSGTVATIESSFDIHMLEEIKTEEAYERITTLIQEYSHNLNDFSLFLYFYQLLYVYLNDKTKFKYTVKRKQYENFRDNFNHNLSILGSTWKNIQATENGQSLIVKFPNATHISYGQRDALTLCIKLQYIKTKIHSGDKCIIIIDEVFDYLDPVNMTAIQYYLSQLLADLKDESILYPIIMTHLSPSFFRNYTFSPKRLNVQYLCRMQATPDRRMKLLLSKREDALIKDDVAHFLFHYAQGTINKRSEFRTLKLPETWGEGTKFYDFIIGEVNKYLEDTTDYDPYAVCTALRIRIEKLVYDKLPENECKAKFIEIHTTKKKLEYAEDILGELPDVYYMLGIIYNDAEHLKDENVDKPIIYRLNNTIIKNMIKNIFDYQGSPIHLNAIHDIKEIVQ